MSIILKIGKTQQTVCSMNKVGEKSPKDALMSLCMFQKQVNFEYYGQVWLFLLESVMERELI